MRIRFKGVRKLWLLYLFLLFFSFFMFAISINVYLQSINKSELIRREQEAHKRLREKSPKNIIVAHYIGTGNLFGNMSKDEFNQNNFAPVESEGALGKPVVIPVRESLVMQRFFQIHNYNILASDRMPLNRTVPDVRKAECLAKKYDDLPTTSVIIVFHNEAWSVLLRTVWSVINRSPRNVLKEILLIDDASDRTYLKDALDGYVSKLPVPTTVLRMPTRKGLVPARLRGAEKATGDVLTFLDAHCECSPGWLEPLLARIKENRKNVVSPVIDIISDNNFGYTKTFELHWGAFNWQLSFRWFVLGAKQILKREHDITEPFPTPAMAGGLFSIDREYFYEIGTYDENMKIWGGENVEMSFRIWQCGGQVEISPCSHVGHIFRKTSPYTFPGGLTEVLSENLARVALVWMDKWADFFFMYNPINTTYRWSLDVSDRLALRERLNCKSFDWYLRNVWPNNFFPADDRFFGKIILLNEETKLSKAYEKYTINIPERMQERNWPAVFKFLNQRTTDFLQLLDLENDVCLKKNLDEPDQRSTVAPAIIGDCLPGPKLQDMFVITKFGQIMTNEGVCLDAFESYEKELGSWPVRIALCSGNKRQIWTYDINTQQVRHKNSRLCLTAYEHAEDKAQSVRVSACQQKKNQRWGLIPLPWKL